MGQCRCECLKPEESEEPPKSPRPFSQHDEEVPNRMPKVVQAYPATQKYTEDSYSRSDGEALSHSGAPPLESGPQECIVPNETLPKPKVDKHPDIDDENLSQPVFMLRPKKSLGVVFTELALPEPNGSLIVKSVARGSPLSRPIMGNRGARAGDVVVAVNKVVGDKSELHQRIQSITKTGGSLHLTLRVRTAIFEVHFVRQDNDEVLGVNLAAVKEVSDRLSVRGIFSQGAMPAWNEQNPSMNVVSGDWIVSVNGTRCLAQQMLESIQASWDTSGECRLEVETG